MTHTLSIRGATLADRVVPRSVLADAALVVGGAALTALAAQLVIPLWPVPITGQTFAVLLVGTVLGMRRGAASLLLYGLAGLVLPVYADGGHGLAVLLGTSGGYIVAFPFAAALTGWLAHRRWDRRVIGTLVSFLAGSAVIYAIGLPWLAVALAQLGQPHDPMTVLRRCAWASSPSSSATP